jgi:5-methylcytosine-specific restriction enzyme A
MCHPQEGRDLLLFQAHSQRGWYRFLGCFACAGVEARRAPDVDGNDREVLVFLLAPVQEVEQSSGEPAAPIGKPLEVLRQLAYAAATAKTAVGREGLHTYRERSAAVRAYVLARAKGVCECCDEAAPFKRQDGSHYLEPHHTRRLADGGPDNPRWFGAICPNCHREIHHGESGKVLNDRLQSRLKRLEEAAGQALVRQPAAVEHADNPIPEPVGTAEGN